MDHFEDIQKLRDLQDRLQKATDALGSAITEKAIAHANYIGLQAKVSSLTIQKDAVLEAIRVEKIAIQNLPQL